MLRYIAKGRAKRKAVTDDERIAVMSQKLEPRLREDKNNRPNVVCIRMYPNKTRRMSSESAFWERVRTGIRLPGYRGNGSHLGQIPETNDECPNSITNPTTTLLQYVLVTTLDMVLDIELVMESGGPPVQRTNEILTGTRSKGQGQDIRDGEVGSRVSEALGRLVRGKAEAD